MSVSTGNFPRVSFISPPDSALSPQFNFSPFLSIHSFPISMQNEKLSCQNCPMCVTAKRYSEIGTTAF